MVRELLTHPGPHIRKNVLPQGMSVTEAAELLGVGRPALSNMLNGNAALSADMAARIERAFGVSARTLMDMQAARDAMIAKNKGVAAVAKSYVPPFLQTKAAEIEDWAETISARGRLAVFLRILINSTGLMLEKTEFHGNDDAERPGWDGFVEASEATPWIPRGKSGWEFGVNADPGDKANKDYAKRIKQVPEDERANIVFIFVTPRRWRRKAVWEEQRREEGYWKDVRVLDSSNLEQWLEQSIPAQAWFANERGVPSEGVLSLDRCWREWSADCEPPPVHALFDPAVEGAKTTVKTRFSESPSDPLVISADSAIEALAFLHCLFSPDDADLLAYRDRVVVFTKAGALAKLASKSSQLIAVAADREVERELAQFKAHLRSIIIYPRNATNTDPDIVLEPLNCEPFNKALQEMGCNRDDVQRLTHESGGSLTVLRRRLSKLEAIRTPSWAADPQAGRSLIPFLFAGSWKANNNADQTILQFLAEDGLSYSSLESNLAALHRLEDPPVWMVGAFRGLVSKVDVLFAINKHIVASDIKRFLDVAKLVLAEDDPSLDLPEDERWAAGVHGKVREISAALRTGISETLVLLAVHGNNLLRERLGIDLEEEIGCLIRELLTPMTTRLLEAQSGDLPMYAEAAPRVFLELIEQDVGSENSQSLGLMRPASTGLFGRCPRTGLLWALENLAWSADLLPRTVLVLGRLSELPINDNWANKPSESLSSIFRCWVPQTAAPVERRTAVLELLAEKLPKIAWRICTEQFEGGYQVGRYNHKPRWRTDGHGFGEPLNNRKEIRAFVRRALDMAIAWKTHDRTTIGDLVASASNLDEADQDAIWNLVEQWSKDAPDEDKSWVREKVRLSALTRRAMKRGAKDGPAKHRIDRARAAYDALLPSDVVLRHEWLFRKPWLEESAEELTEESIDYHKREERIEAQRISALHEVLAALGIDGILRLAEMGDAADVIGFLLSKIYTSDDELVSMLQTILDRGPIAEPGSRRSIVFGALNALQKEREETILPALVAGLEDHERVLVLALAPFNSTTWDIVSSKGEDMVEKYWREVRPRLSRNSAEELQLAVDRLISVDRPRAAFHLIRIDIKSIQPKQLFRLLRAMATNSAEPSGTYQLESYAIRKAFERLEECHEIALDEMAGLEFQYIDVFDREEGSIPHLDQHIEEHPELFVQAVAFAYKRSDNGEDPEEIRHDNTKQLQDRAIACYKLLERLSRIPGRDRVGELDSAKIEEWVKQVRAGCEELARGEVGDISLGKLFASAPTGDDEVWPCNPVRDALEKVMSDDLSNGITTALYNARGVHFRGEGGGQERELADKYRKWAQALEFTHPRVSRLHVHMVETYEGEAKSEDTDAVIRKRLRY